ncbi:NusG domain II-containing protein [candidate division KSB1 bacterium]|nr:NusG domain II-containing protein [candidate division KSB1 bacterium]
MAEWREKLSFAPLVKHLTIGDKILLFFLAVLTVTGFLLTNTLRSGGLFAEIQVNGRHVATLSLLEDRQITVPGWIGPVEISVRNGKISVLSSPCLWKICVRSGPVSKAGDIIVCIPSKLVIRIFAKNMESLDAVTG